MVKKRAIGFFCRIYYAHIHLSKEMYSKPIRRTID
nr:MAG TPA: hypothetical protein [Caudoviricetes sp.]